MSAVPVHLECWYVPGPHREQFMQMVFPDALQEDDTVWPALHTEQIEHTVSDSKVHSRETYFPLLHALHGRHTASAYWVQFFAR